MPEKPIPEQDPITGKSYALHYLIATVILIGTLFWALYDEAWGQRPWKEFQDQWKDRYSAFLNTARSKSAKSEQSVEQDPQYVALKQDYENAYQDSKAASDAARKKLDDASARLLAVQSVFTDRRAYVNALTYELETSTSDSAKASKKSEIKEYKDKKATVEFPDGSKKDFNFEELEETYNEIRDERTKLSLELGDVLKPVTAAKAKMDEYISDHMVDLTPAQIEGLKRRATEWDPAIVQINVAEANIVDRCESCHMNTREPLKITEAAMIAKGAKKPDEYAKAFASHPEPELLAIHDPEKFGCSPCHQGNGRATTSVEKAHGNYEHWLWPLYPKENSQAGCQSCHAADMVLASGDTQFHTINNGKDLFRQRGCMGCHRYEGYDKEPDDLNSIGQQIKQIETQKKENVKQHSGLDEAGRRRRIERRSQRAQHQGRRPESREQQAGRAFAAARFPVAQPDAGPEESRAQSERCPAQAEQELDSGVAEEAIRFPAHDEDAELPPDRSSDSGDLGLHLAIRFHRRTAQAQARKCRTRQRIVRGARMSRLPLHRRRRSDAWAERSPRI